jgi:dihydropteroate synthase
MYDTDYRLRVLCIENDEDLAAELASAGAAAPGIFRMLPKSRCYSLKMYDVHASVAHVLKESFLAAGGDAAISRETMIGASECTDVILIGTRKSFSSAAKALLGEPIGGPRLAAEIESAIAVYESGPVLPELSSIADPKSRWMFSEMANRTLVMGILNVTPDSFSDGGAYLDHDAAIERAMTMVEEGADIIDIGGESSRPGSEPVPVEEEINRVVPAIRELAKRTDRPISIDTYKSATAEAALDAGASIINDISGMLFDPDMKRLAAERGCPVVIMHIKGAPRDMQKDPTYEDLMGEIADYLRKRIGEAIEAGVDERVIIIDPGIGFGKTIEHNLTILRRLSEFKSLGHPILVGTSRKSTIGQALGGLPPEERIEGTAATVALTISSGANIVRVHDVKEMARVAKMTDAIVRGVSSPLRRSKYEPSA